MTQKYTKEYFQEMGKKGGEKTKTLYGLKHYDKISKKGVKARNILPREQAKKEDKVKVIPNNP